MSYDIYTGEIEKYRRQILEAERRIWFNPEPGYKEWKTHAYLKGIYEGLGYTVREAGNIPGFCVDIETGRPGPRIAVFGELDSLIVPTHPECDKATGAVHSCGHNCQSAALYGVAAALKAPGALDALCGAIRLIAVPAEEGIDIGYRNELRKQDVIRYIAGKQEFMYRGFLDGVDIAFMIHTGQKDCGFSYGRGQNGTFIKTAVFKGKSAHAGSAPWNGRNALYAATNAILAANSLRETFKDDDTIRFHPIITEGGSSVNSIPDCVKVESYVRGGSLAAMKDANEKINRAFAGAAAAMDCELELHDIVSYHPNQNDLNLGEVLCDAAKLFLGAKASYGGYWGTGSTDMGDISSVIPSLHPYVGGAVGATHSSEYFIVDPESACVTSAKIQSVALAMLLEVGAVRAKKIIAEKHTVYSSIKEYFAAVDATNTDVDAVTRNPDGTITLKFK